MEAHLRWAWRGAWMICMPCNLGDTCECEGCKKWRLISGSYTSMPCHPAGACNGVCMHAATPCNFTDTCTWCAPHRRTLKAVLLAIVSCTHLDTAYCYRGCSCCLLGSTGLNPSERLNNARTHVLTSYDRT